MKAWILKVIREPIIQFVFIGSLLLCVDILRNPDDYRVSNNEIIVTDAALTNFMQQRAKIFNSEEAIEVYKQLTVDQKEKLKNDFFHQEALYREALSNNFDKNDPIIKRRLVQKVDYLSQGFYDEVPVIQQEELDRYFQSYKENYRRPALITFTHVFLKSSGNNASYSKAELLLDELNNNKVPFEQSGLFGERFLYNRNYVNREMSEIESHFGDNFKNVIFSYDISSSIEPSWLGPIESKFGWHLVLVTKVSKAYIPDFEMIESDIRSDLYRERQFSVKMEKLNQIKSKFNLVDKTSNYD